MLLPLLLWWPGDVGVVVQVCRTLARTSHSRQLLLERLQLDAAARLRSEELISAASLQDRMLV